MSCKRVSFPLLTIVGLLTLLAACPVYAGPIGASFMGYIHATDCTGGGVIAGLGQQCTDLDDGKFWTCKTPSAGGVATVCDAAGDWLPTGFSVVGGGILSINGATGAAQTISGSFLIDVATDTGGNTITLGLTNGDHGDISTSGLSWTVDSGAITNAKLATMATATIKGRLTAGTGPPEDLSDANIVTLLDSLIATQSELDSLTASLSSTSGAITDAENPVDWKQLKNVPTDFADGTDATGGVGGGGGSLQDAVTIGRLVTDAVDLSSAVGIGGSTRRHLFYCTASECVWALTATQDLNIRPADNFDWNVLDSADANIINADEATKTVTFGGQIVASNKGVELTESDTNPTCAAGNYTIYADTSDAKLKKCTNGSVTDLDTGGAGGTPAGSDTQLQYNNATAFGGITGATTNGTIVTLTSPVFVTPALGTPASGTLSNTTGFPAANLAGTGTGVTTLLATPSSANLATALTDETGSGLAVFGTSPTLITPVLGVAAATSINGLTLTASTGTFTLTNLKTLAVTNTLTLSGTDSTVMTFPSTTATIARTDAGQTFTGVQVMTSPKVVTSIADTNGNTLLGITATGSATQYLTLNNDVAAGTASLIANVPTQITTALAGTNVALTASAATAGSVTVGAAAGGAVTITSGLAARLSSGNANGGNINLVTGAGIGTGVAGQVLIPQGVLAAPSLAFTGGTVGTGIYYNAGSPRLVNAGAVILEWQSDRVLIGSGGTSTILRTNGLHALTTALGQTDFSSDGTNTLQIGTDSATGTTATYKSYDGVGTDKKGADLNLQCGNSTGAGTQCIIALRGAYSGTASNGTVNTPTDRMIISGAKTLTDTAVSLFEIALPAAGMSGGTINYTIEASDGTDHQALSNVCSFSVVNKAGTYTKAVTCDAANVASAVSSGTLTATLAFLDGTNKVTMQITPAGSLTETTYRVSYVVTQNAPHAITIL